MTSFAGQILTDERYRYLDVATCIAYGAWLGQFVQRGADSGEIFPERILKTTVLCGLCYAIGAISALGLKKIMPSVPNWVIAAIAGSVLFALYWSIGVRLIGSDDYQTIRLPFLLKRFALQSLFFPVPLLFVLAIVRSVRIFLHKPRFR